MKKLVSYGLLWWVLIFIEVSIIGFTPGFATMGESGFTLLPKGIVIHFLILVLFSALLGKLYFKKAVPNWQSVIISAAVIISIGLLLDAIITVPFFVKNYFGYYSKWTLWVGVGIFLIVFCFMGKLRKKEHR